jgi:3-oxoacyl-[acyl-carrier protein] reductase
MIILTGSSGGIGQAILPSLAKFDSVLAVYNSKKPDLTNINDVEAVKLDITSEYEILEFVASIKKKISRVTLIHSAVLSIDGLSAKFATNDWDAIMNVNLRGVFLLNRAMLIPMVEEKWGRIIHISSVTGIKGVSGTIAYSTTKTALLGMSRVLAKEYARFGITSNVLIPGYFSTGLIDTLSEKIRNKILESIPSKRLGNPQNIANAIEFIIKSDYVNGSEINIDGGI